MNKIMAIVFITLGLLMIFLGVKTENEIIQIKGIALLVLGQTFIITDKINEK